MYDNMKLLFVLILVFMAGFAVGYEQHKRELPSCLYLERPRAGNIKPWGCDGKEGIDWYYDEIEGGGLYVSLHEWKQ